MDGWISVTVRSARTRHVERSAHDAVVRAFDNCRGHRSLQPPNENKNNGFPVQTRQRRLTPRYGRCGGEEAGEEDAHDARRPLQPCRSDGVAASVAAAGLAHRGPGAGGRPAAVRRLPLVSAKVSLSEQRGGGFAQLVLTFRKNNNLEVLPNRTKPLPGTAVLCGHQGAVSGVPFAGVPRARHRPFSPPFDVVGARETGQEEERPLTLLSNKQNPPNKCTCQRARHVFSSEGWCSPTNWRPIHKCMARLVSATQGRPTKNPSL